MDKGRITTLLLCSLTLIVAGCGGANLLTDVSNFWSLGICGTIIVIVDIIFLVEILGSTRSSGDKVLWSLLIIFFPVLGLILYYLMGRK